MKSTRGFTLIELLVATAIIVAISSVILLSNGRFGGVVQLENLAYDVALSIRQAQVSGLSVMRFGVSTFTAGYGVHFDAPPAGATSYALFADALNPNGRYDCSNPVNPTPENCELVTMTDITGGFRIQDLCATPPNGTESCGISKLDILFKRPEPDAWISAGDNPCILLSGSCQESARIILTSPRGDTMSVVAEINGQISVRRGIQ